MKLYHPWTESCECGIGRWCFWGNNVQYLDHNQIGFVSIGDSCPSCCTPSTKATLGTMLTSAYCPPRPLHQWLWLSFLCKVTQQSSANRPVDHCCIVQVSWGSGYYKRSQRGLGVSGITCHGHLAFKSKLWMVCLDTTIQITSSKWACSCVTLLSEKILRYWSWWSLVGLNSWICNKLCQ